MLGMRSSVGSMVKLVKTMGGDEDKLVRQIQTESLATPRPARLFSGLSHVWFQEAYYQGGINTGAVC